VSDSTFTDRTDPDGLTENEAATQHAVQAPRAADQQLRAQIRDALRSPQPPGIPRARWVRAGDLLSDAGAHLSSHGIALTAALHRSPRALLRSAARGAGCISAMRTLDRFATAEENSTTMMGLRL